jgi:uncharacterized protein DUF5996
VAVAVWPELAYAGWRDTLQTVHLWTQIVGKTRLALTPWLNHSWHVPFYVTARGIGTSPIPSGTDIFEIDFDFVGHRLLVRTSRGDAASFALARMSVAEFHGRFFGLLDGLGFTVAIDDMPSEIANGTPFTADHAHASYDAVAVHRCWRALIQCDRVFKLFRTGFLGKASPVHFFWGSFDLAASRFSGRSAPRHPGGVPGLSDAVTCEAYSHEESSAGFWPGNDGFPHPAFYSYAYPEPKGYRERQPSSGAYFDTKLGEFILPYEAVRTAADPDALLLDFLLTTYAAAADAGGWDRAALECPLGEPGRVRQL